MRRISEQPPARIGRHGRTQPAHARKPARKAGLGGRSVALVVVVALFATLVAGGALAWMTASGTLANVFGIASVDPSVAETLTDGIKSGVKATNSSNIPAYVRAQVNVYWVDEDGNQAWDEPVAGTNYTIEWGSSTTSTDAVRWLQGSDGLWYWTAPLSVGASTNDLVERVTSGQEKTGYRLVVDVVTQAIQAEPSEAVVESWGVTLDGSGIITAAGTTGGN